MKNKQSSQNIFLIISFGLFGLTALIFQVVFAKQLVLLFGLTAPAIATVLAVYFSGLAIGSIIFGKIVDKFQKIAHRIYVFLFLLTGIYGISLPFLFPILNKIILAINSVYPLNFSGFNFFAFLLSFLFLIFPAILIGGSFPVISKIFIKRSEVLGKKVSLLYFVNTIGSVVGAALAGFWLIPAVGNNATIFSASILNIVIAGLLFVVFRPFPQFAEVGPLQEAQPQKMGNPIFLYVLFLTGFLALSLEVLYTKTLILFIGSSTYAFSLILITFLLGIALGSLVVSLFIDRLRQKQAYFGIFLGLTGFWLFLTMKFFEELPFWYLKIFQSFQSFEFSAIISAQFFLTFLVIFPATFLMGIIFPLGIKLANPSLEKLGRGIGKLYFSNTLGGVLGSLIAGFFLLPSFGYQKTLIFILLIYSLLGGIFTLKGKTLNFAIKGIFVFFFIFWGVFAVFSSGWSEKVLSLGIFPYAKSYINLGEEEIKRGLKTDELVFYREGLSQVAVVKRGESLFLRINGKTDASTVPEDLEAEILSGALPMLFHKNPEDVLVIGLGSGITLGAVTQFDEAKRIGVVEIDPAIVKAAGYFKEHNNDALNDSRVKTILADARNYLYLADKNKKYDVISSEPSNPWVSGNASLFSREFYNLAKNHLKDNGLMFQWIHAYSLNLNDLKTVIKTFGEVFPETYLFDEVQGGNLFLIGALSQSPILHFAEIEEKLRNEKVQNELAWLYIENPYELLSYFVSSGDVLKELSQTSRIHSDNNPFLEFSAPKALYKSTLPENLAWILSLRQKTNFFDFVVGGDSQELSRYFDLRQKLIPVRIALSQGNLDGVLHAYKEVADTGLSNVIVQNDIFRFIYRYAEELRKAGRKDEAEALWEKSSFIFNLIEVGGESK